MKKEQNNMGLKELQTHKANKYISEGNFDFTYKKLLIGNLIYKDDLWHFLYSEIWKNEKFPIIPFSKLDKFYQSEYLWPIFVPRIPVLNQPYMFKMMKKKKIHEKDYVGRLHIFGRQTLTDPFILSLRRKYIDGLKKHENG